MQKYITNLKGLDILRFLLSFSVIIWHYQHFFYPFFGENNRAAFVSQQPCYPVFRLFYDLGNYAVQFFWLVSGIIFYKIYGEKVAGGKVTFSEFFIKRFTRLYPLHFVMLIVVFLLQQISLRTLGDYFIYPGNTIKNFFLNLLFIQSWGANKFSFNGPTWSVSIEILAYLLFFLLAFSGLVRTWLGLITTVIVVGIIKKWQLVLMTTDMRDCIYFFFLGCLFIKLFDLIAGRRKQQLIMIGILLLLWAIDFYNIGRPENVYHISTGFLDIGILSTAMIVVFLCLIIFNLPVFDRMNVKIFSTLGNITYSTYLVHFPIQLLIMLVLQPAGYELFLTKGFFFGYLLSTIVLGYFVYHYFELPVQNWLRKLSEPRK